MAGDSCNPSGWRGSRTGFRDLQPLKTVIGKARIVALGEATHGTREFFQLKHRMLEFLVTAKAVIWAHNAHVSRSDVGLPMGSHLSKWFGAELVSIMLSFNQGEFQAVQKEVGLRKFSVPPAPGGSLDRLLSEPGIPSPRLT